MNSAEIKIENNVPVPSPKLSKAKYPWTELAVGQSFFVRCGGGDLIKLRNSMTSSRNWAQRKTGWVFALRQVRMDSKVGSGIRAWRTA